MNKTMPSKEELRGFNREELIAFCEDHPEILDETDKQLLNMIKI